MKQKIQEDLKQAMREGDMLKTGVLRMILSSLSNKEKEKRYKTSKDNPQFSDQEIDEKAALSDEENQEVVFSEFKKRREAIEGFEKGGREEMAEKERKEMEMVQAYLPEQLSEDKIRELVKEAIEVTSASGAQDMGKIMGSLMPKVKGKADGSLVNKIVKEMLG